MYYDVYFFQSRRLDLIFLFIFLHFNPQTTYASQIQLYKLNY